MTQGAVPSRGCWRESFPGRRVPRPRAGAPGYLEDLDGTAACHPGVRRPWRRHADHGQQEPHRARARPDHAEPGTRSGNSRVAPVSTAIPAEWPRKMRAGNRGQCTGRARQVMPGRGPVRADLPQERDPPAADQAVGAGQPRPRLPGPHAPQSATNACSMIIICAVRACWRLLRVTAAGEHCCTSVLRRKGWDSEVAMPVWPYAQLTIAACFAPVLQDDKCSGAPVRGSFRCQNGSPPTWEGIDARSEGQG